MSKKHARDQYVDGVHDVGATEMYAAEAKLVEGGANDVLFCMPEFADDGSWTPSYPKNQDPPPEFGTTNMHDVAKLMSAGYTDEHGHTHRGPTALICSVDNGATWQFVSDVLAAE